MKRLLILSALLCVAIASQAQANSINAGDFEIYGDIVPGSLTISAPNSFAGPSNDAWTVTSGSVIWANEFFWVPPVFASNYATVDLDGNSPGSIQQSFSTVPGQSYTVTFALSGVPGNGLGTNSLNASAGSIIDMPFSYTLTSANRYSNMLYAPESFTFQATGPTTTLTFASTDPSSSAWYGPVVGDVNVDSTPALSVPEPSDMLFLVPGLVGLVSVRRRLKKQAE